MPSPTLKPLIDMFHANGRPRVISLVVTIFGDAALPRGGEIAMTDLTAITGNIGVSPGALRTAMSRLAAEGWVEREKVGRNSLYRLSDQAREDSNLAAEIIYAADPVSHREWIVSIDQNAVDDGAAAISKSVRILPVGQRLAEVDAGRFVLLGSPLHTPKWVKDAVAPPELYDQFRALKSALAAEDLFSEAANLSPLDAMSARILIAHFWRRLILRHPFLPESFVSTEWPGLDCHAEVAAVYKVAVDEAEPYWGTPTSNPGRAIIGNRFQ
ncbi:MAG: PaaX family transcriptional regulator C-terminal domain-containing protein [Paracoccaceae bacterium]|nr:PaaX family transcriptional regulator C-terminal domain-containing protein [Paracoccaceae bacterium]MDG1369659.1 PaaX family transcriptional regulator C-terminal domain-containing protein [Paracoccaceae bacterium]